MYTGKLLYLTALKIIVLFIFLQTVKWKLQFFYIDDLCKVIETIIKNHSEEKIYNVGNEEPVSIKEWVKLCYEVVGKDVIFKNVNADIEQRNYFSFYNYEYELDITRQKNLLKETTNLREGLRE